MPHTGPTTSRKDKASTRIVSRGFAVAGFCVVAVGLGSSAVMANSDATPTAGSPSIQASGSPSDLTAWEEAATPTPVVIVPDKASADRPTTADEAVAYVRGLTAEVKQADRTEAVLTTWGRLQQSGGPVDGDAPAGFSADRSVWVVVVAGKFAPQFAQGASYPWGAVVLDEATGAPIASFAGNAPWPTWWDAISSKG